MSFKPPLLGQPQMHQVLPDHIKQILSNMAYPLMVGSNVAPGITKFEYFATHFVSALIQKDVFSEEECVAEGIECAKQFISALHEMSQGKPQNDD